MAGLNLKYDTLDKSDTLYIKLHQEKERRIATTCLYKQLLDDMHKQGGPSGQWPANLPEGP